MAENKELSNVPTNQGDLLPVLTPADAKRAYQAYLELCQAILVPYDNRKEIGRAHV